MPSYRYLRDIKPEDLQPETEKKPDGMDKARNWWHYHYKAVIAALLGLMIVIAVTVDALSRTKPDLRIGLLSPYTPPQELLEYMEGELAQLVGDVNGDGVSTVAIETYTVAGGGEENDPYAQMAGMVKIAAAIDTGDPVMFMAEEPYIAAYQEAYGMFGMPGGEKIAQGAQTGVYTLAVSLWLRNPEPPFTAQDGQAVDLRELLGQMRMGVRPLEGTQLAAQEDAMLRWQSAWDLMYALGYE